MKELLELMTPWGIGTVLATAVLFGFFPKFVMHLIVMIYPRNHPRRRELPAELEAVPYRERVLWVFGQCAAVLFDGVPARVREFRARRRARAWLRGPKRSGTDRYVESINKEVAGYLVRQVNFRMDDRHADYVLRNGDTTYLFEVKHHNRPGIDDNDA